MPAESRARPGSRPNGADDAGARPSGTDDAGVRAGLRRLGAAKARPAAESATGPTGPVRGRTTRQRTGRGWSEWPTRSTWAAPVAALPEIAARLGIPPQTARQRLRQVHRLFGAPLADPDARFEAGAALRAGAGRETDLPPGRTRPSAAERAGSGQSRPGSRRTMAGGSDATTSMTGASPY
ncbi:helix-turn-helix domain-containing protein [Streptomyces collinus]|uniref:helix-turn-helix domain-containing protein n=1 Tax=Streptomyces collinus TaxID=42684 RepID=UPI0038107AAA